VGQNGSYPTDLNLSTPTGIVTLTLHSWHDARTIHEIFLAEDYRIDGKPNIIVDFGSNIGISAAYFLTRNSSNRIYLFEPVPKNMERLKQNLAPFSERYVSNEKAVGTDNGVVRFGIEDSGRYGGIGLDTGAEIEVGCVDSNMALQDVLNTHGKIDVLKIDVETMEHAIVNRLPRDLAEHVDLILVEARFGANPLAKTHAMSGQGTVTRFSRRQ
jgi:FkbM family methyltransferase